jgi:hypothetical protein
MGIAVSTSMIFLLSWRRREKYQRYGWLFVGEGARATLV